MIVKAQNKINVIKRTQTVRKQYSFNTTNILNDWFDAYVENPYPTAEIKMELAEKTSLTILQISYWMSNKRKQLKNKLNEH